MIIQDRTYQIEAVESFWRYFREREHPGHPVIAMPTGTGKSIVIARLLQSVFSSYPNQKVLMLTHVKTLIKQNYAKLIACWPFAPCGIYSAGLKQKVHNKPITFAGIQSVAKKAALFGHVDLVIIDEAHLVSPSDETQYQTFLQGLFAINPNLKVIGLTATPWRLGHGHITDPAVKPNGDEVPSLFTDVCFDITGVEPFNRLIAEGFLIPLIPKSTQTVLDVDGVHMRGGEFLAKELQTAVDKNEITFAALKEAMEVGAKRKKWLIFAAGTDHADHIADMLTTLGKTCCVVHSKINDDSEKLIDDFRKGKYDACVNANMLTTGFDDEEIDLIICLRPTASSVLWVQMLGRGTRPWFMPGYDLNEIGGRLASIAASKKQNCLVLDYAQNARRLGPINDPVVPRRKGQGGGEAPVKECPICKTWVHASIRFCNGILADDVTKCTHEFTFETKLKQGASTDEVIKGDSPIVEVFKVDHITVSQHDKAGSYPSLKVSYYCGLMIFQEYVTIEHKLAWARGKAEKWWAARSSLPCPTTVADSINLADKLKMATHLRIWINKQYPDILAQCFDGTAFGKEELNDAIESPPIEKRNPGQFRLHAASKYEDDDEIPF